MSRTLVRIPTSGIARAGARKGARFAILVLVAMLAHPVQADEKAAVRRMQAEELAAADRCEEAIDTLGPAAEDDPAAGLLRGRCQIRLRRYVEALETLDAVRAKEPSLPGLELERGIALYHVGDLDAARTALAEARAQGQEGDPRLDLYEGLLLLQQAKVEDAAIALERARRAGGKRVDPVASYYAGVAWSALDERQRAEDALRRVIEEDPGGPWAEEAERLLRGPSRPVAGGRPWALVQLGMEYDSNVVLARDNATLPSNISDKDGTRGVWYLEGGSELFRKGDWSGGALLSYSGNAHIESRVNEFDTDYPVASGWLDFQAGRNDRARLRYDAGYAWVDYDDYLWSNDVTLSLLHRWGKWGQTEPFVAYEYNNYYYSLRDTATVDYNDLDRDGSGVTGGFIHYVPFLDGQVVGRIGYSLGRYWSEGSEYDSLANRVLAGFVAQLPFQVSWDTEASFTYDSFYNHSIYPMDPNSANPRQHDRLDKTWEVVTGLSKAITDYLSVSATYFYTDVNSNVPIYTYDRHVVGGYVTLHFN